MRRVVRVLLDKDEVLRAICVACADKVEGLLPEEGVSVRVVVLNSDGSTTSKYVMLRTVIRMLVDS